MRTSNPALNDAVFRIHDASATDAMTLQGTVVKTGILLSLLVIAAGFTWGETMTAINQAPLAEAVEGAGRLAAAPQVVYNFLLFGAIGGFVLALVTIFKPVVAPYTSPLYAVAEGLFLGGISALFETMYSGVVIPAIALTFGTLAALLTAYATRLVKATENFKLGVVAATGGIAIFYLATMVLGMFGVTVFSSFFQSGAIGIGFSLFVVVIAALNLVLDFDFIEKGCESGAPKYMEWYAGFGLLVTLVWLYLEILRLLVKLRGRD